MATVPPKATSHRARYESTKVHEFTGLPYRENIGEGHLTGVRVLLPQDATLESLHPGRDKDGFSTAAQIFIFFFPLLVPSPKCIL